MKPWKKITIGLLCGTGLLVIAARLTGAVQYYNIPTASSEPTVMMGQKIFSTNLRQPKRDDFVVYRHPKADSMNIEANGSYGQVYLHRLSAGEDDVVQMKAGVFYVNGKNTDINKNLLHFYTVAAADLEKLPGNADKYFPVTEMVTGEYLVNFTDKQVAALSSTLPLKKYLVPVDDTEQGTFAWCGQQNLWTADDFGPLPVPAGYCFVMGDNRQNSLDSRWTGFVKLSDIVGIKL